jgi:hypothetical protein
VLIEKLGLDIPPPPEVTLEEITAREIRIAWKQPEFHNSIHKHIIQVNGAKGKLCSIKFFPQTEKKKKSDSPIATHSG